MIVMRKTSIDAYNAIRASGLLSKMRLRVLEAIAFNDPCTSGEAFKWLMDKGEYSNPLSQSRARVTELKKLGVIREFGIRKCNVSGQKTLVYELTGNGPNGKICNSTTTKKISLCLTCHKWGNIGSDFCDCGLWGKIVEGTVMK